MYTEENIRATLKSYQDPFLKKDLISTGALKEISISNHTVKIDMQLTYPGIVADIKKNLLQLLQETYPTLDFILNINWKIEPRAIQSGLESIAQIKNIIAVASGKGGVGKSTTTVNLALALAALGAKVGILDADIYGPNQPHMLGVTAKPEIKEKNKIQPLMAHGVQSMSIGYLIDKNAPLVWRGPMVTGALMQLLKDTDWEPLDYLLVDLPPGTGDIQLTLAQKIPVSGAVIVTTPQEISLLDARKGIEMFTKVKIPILGIVENMSTHFCSHCGHEENIFGAGGGQKIADEYHVPLLGALPLDKRIREETDNGNPTVVANPLSELAKRYRDIALKMTAQLSLQARNYATAFPKIIIENN